MSPEQRSGHPLDPRSDQYSFFLAFYWALHGRMPFNGDEPTADRLTDELPRHPPVHVDAVPGWLYAVIQRGLSRRPSDRFASMSEVVVELTRDRRRRLPMAPALIGAFALAAIAAVGFAPQVRNAACRSDAEERVAQWDARRATLAWRFTGGDADAME
mgnify:FL=1